MMRFVRDLRLVPITVIAAACLLVLKTADLMLDRAAEPTSESASPADAETTIIRTAPGVPRPSEARRSWAQQMFNFPDANGPPAASTDLAQLPTIAPTAADKANADIITGSVPAKSDDKSEATGAVGKDGKNLILPNGKVNLTEGAAAPSGAERALLERLQERRQELDKRSRELDIREGLIAEAERRMEARLAEIKEGEAQLATATQKKDEAEAARFKGLVTMYENMKPRDAAKIFDRLDMSVLMEVATQINPRRMSDILALMSPETAEKLTVELASRAKAATKPGDALPKIEGRPTGQ
jgi:flagellar motility protein MotE (MotC chaperone)